MPSMPARSLRLVRRTLLHTRRQVFFRHFIKDVVSLTMASDTKLSVIRCFSCMWRGHFSLLLSGFSEIHFDRSKLEFL